MTVYEFVLPQSIIEDGFEQDLSSQFGGFTSWYAKGAWGTVQEAVTVFRVATHEGTDLRAFVRQYASEHGEQALYFSTVGEAENPLTTPLPPSDRQARAVISEWRDAHLDGNLALALAIERANPDLFDEKRDRYA